MRSADEWFEAYGESHQNPVNKKIHWVCVPLILVSLVGLLWELRLPINLEGEVGGVATGELANAGMLLLFLSLSYYAMISRPLAIGMTIVAYLSILGVFGIKMLSTTLNLSLWQGALMIFILAWIGQFIGHKIEGKKPSFFEDLQFLMIGPLWLLGFIYRRFKIGY